MRSTHFEEPEHLNETARVKLSGTALAVKAKKASGRSKPQKPAK
jgi:hypothetical protein